MTNKKPSQAELAAALGLTPGRITGLKKQGMPIYSVEAARAWRAQNIAPVPTAKSTPTALPGKADAPTVRPPGYDESRARRERAEAAMAEMREAEMRGELIRVDAVRSALAGVLSATRDAFLGLPDRMAVVAGQAVARPCGGGAAQRRHDRRLAHRHRGVLPREPADPRRSRWAGCVGTARAVRYVGGYAVLRRRPARPPRVD